MMQIRRRCRWCGQAIAILRPFKRSQLKKGPFQSYDIKAVGFEKVIRGLIPGTASFLVDGGKDAARMQVARIATQLQVFAK